jgi:hypothetical protein
VGGGGKWRLIDPKFEKFYYIGTRKRYLKDGIFLKKMVRYLYRGMGRCYLKFGTKI